MSSPEVSPASLFLAPDSERERKMTATSGRKCYERYGRFSPIGLLVKTLLESSRWYSPAVKLRWDVKNLCSERLTEKRILHRQEYVVETVCNDLEREGYSVQPVVIPACAVGAPHRRDRVFFIAHRADAGVKGMQRKWENNILSGRAAPNSDVYRHTPCKTGEGFEKCRCKNDGESKKRKQSSEWPNGFHGFPRNVTYTNDKLSQSRNGKGPERRQSPDIRTEPFVCPPDWENFPTQSPVCSRDDGISTRLDGIAFSKWRQESIKAYGNAIVPQVMYEIFLAIESIEKGK